MKHAALPIQKDSTMLKNNHFVFVRQNDNNYRKKDIMLEV
ncbi:hypothetical protein L291_1082 [Acinetobacter guillouiae MSP4-18]|nr:hypothetical protein L291_1082 [Acinetobacter guillouiae MSP4-18]